MDAGGDPGRDDSGLPPVDIEVPDDARELDRDVLAYRREQRARRRRKFWRRLFAPLRGHAAVMPLIAACMALSMLAGALLSVFTISPASAPVLPRPHPRAPQSAPAAGTSPGRLPRGTVTVAGKPRALRGIASAVLALVPAGCQCGNALRQLAAQGAGARVSVFFVGTGATAPEAARLAAADGRGTAVAVNDTRGVLTSAYHPAGLTVVLVGRDGYAAVRRNLAAGSGLRSQIAKLAGPGST